MQQGQADKRGSSGRQPYGSLRQGVLGMLLDAL